MGELRIRDHAADKQLLKQYSPHEVNIYERDWRPGGQFQCAELRREHLRSWLDSRLLVSQLRVERFQLTYSRWESAMLGGRVSDTA